MNRRIKYIKKKYLILLQAIFLLFSTLIHLNCKSIAYKNNDVSLEAFEELMKNNFPENEYIYIIGYGNTEESARQNSDAELSSFFSTSIKKELESESLIYENYAENFSESRVQKKEREKISITSDLDLSTISHTKAFKIKDKYAVCAYVNKIKAWEIISEKLKSYSQEVTQYYAFFKKEKGNWEKIIYLNKIKNLYDDFIKNYYTGLIIKPEEAKKFSTIVQVFNKAKTQSIKLKSQTLLFLNENGTESAIKNAVAEFFTQNGFTITTNENKKNYTVNIKIKCEVIFLQSEKFYTCYPDCLIEIIDSEDRSVFSWTKKINRVTAYSENSALNISIKRIIKEIEKDFSIYYEEITQ